MQIKECNRETGWITLEMEDTELRAITNLLCRARTNDVSFGKKDYEVYSNLYTAITILHSGYLPDFELNHIKELRELSQADKAEELRGKENE